MKRTRIDPKNLVFPAPFRHFLQSGAVYDSSCSPEARVFFLEKDGGYFLKCAPKGTLAAEAKMTDYFYRKGLSVPVLEYLSLEKDWMLTPRLVGEDCTHAAYLAEPERLCDLLAVTLRRLHETPAADCPVSDRMSAYFDTVEQNHRQGIFDSGYLMPRQQGMDADEAFALAMQGRMLLKDRSLLHGDYCLPNILLDGWRFSGFIDLGNGGVGDRHVDVYWGVWTLQFNLKTSRYADRFLDAYGRDKVDPALLDVIGAAECFG